jgi:hypothetical protein
MPSLGVSSLDSRPPHKGGLLLVKDLRDFQAKWSAPLARLPLSSSLIAVTVRGVRRNLIPIRGVATIPGVAMIAVVSMIPGIGSIGVINAIAGIGVAGVARIATVAVAGVGRIAAVAGVSRIAGISVPTVRTIAIPAG